MANISTLSCTALTGISKTWEALLFSLKISFLMSSVLTSVKQNVFASHWLVMARMDRWSLHFNFALRVGSVIFLATESTSEYLEIFRFFTIFEKKLFKSFIWFWLMPILSSTHNLSESNGLLFSKTFYQLFPLNLSFYNSTLSLIFTEEIDSNRLSSILFLKKLLQSLDLVITSLGSYFVIKDVGLPRTYFFFWGACLFSTSKFILQNLYSPLSLFMNSSFESFSNTL